MPKKTLIFDFDGTIADSLHHLIGISNRLSQEFGFKFIPPDDIPVLKDKTSLEIIKHLGIPLLKVPALAARIKKEMSSDMTSIPIVKGLTDSLAQLRPKIHCMGILSSNSPGNISAFLTRHRIDFFDFIFTTSRIWSKDIQLVKLMQEKGLSLEDVIYVGDEVRDILAARKAGIKSAAAAWGYNSAEALQRADPDYLLRHPSELIHLFGAS